ncbi:unnamed protein product [Haemonchus placei]|uniref:Phlebovirus_G2 domain-containing protein n=1 Tax=Haemonchus placei TaxID=6290 RepID=A0A0N4WY24_HAEPC|nr:unnamed protein product [Haemonchus placei]
MMIYVVFAVPLVIGKPLLNIVQIIGSFAARATKTIFKLHMAIFRCLLTLPKRRRNRRMWAEIAVAVSVIAVLTQGCQEVDVLHQHTEICRITSKKDACTIDTTEVVKINPFSREACLRLTANDSTVTELRLLWQQLQLICEKETTKKTRCTTYGLLLDSKQCSRVGSCKDEKCASVKRSSLLRELERANQYPGVTGCTESCEGLGCDCF